MKLRSAIRSTTLGIVAWLASCSDDSSSGMPGEESSTGSDAETSADPSGANASAEGNVDSSAGESDSASSTGAPAEPCVDTCVAVPRPWNGPVAVTRTPMVDDAPTCPAAYPDPVGGELFGDLAAMDLMCMCACALDEVVCPTHVTLDVFDDLVCAAEDMNYSITTMCNSGPAGQLGSWRASSEPVDSGSCTAQSGVVPTPAGFDTRWTLCAGDASAGACEAGEVCAPAAAPFERMCIWQDGDHDCPSDGFTERELVHTDLDDQRGCAECTCSDVAGTCTGTIRLWGADGCPMGGIEDIMTVELDSCVEYDAQAAMLIEPLEPTDDVACPPSAPTPTGEVVPTGPVTVCCASD